jgi:hypothetical protein
MDYDCGKDPMEIQEKNPLGLKIEELEKRVRWDGETDLT